MTQFSKELYDTGKYDVVYRNGERPKEVIFFSDGRPCSLESAGSPIGHKTNGFVFPNGVHNDYDLFLIPKERWANVFRNDAGVEFMGGHTFDSKEEAVKNGRISVNYLETVKLVSE